MRSNQFLKVKNYLLELENILWSWKIEKKIKREIEELFFKPIIVPKDKMDNSEEQIMRKVRPIKKNWFGPLIKQIMVREKKPKIHGDKLKDKIIRDIWTLFETEEEKEERKKEA